MRLITSTSSGFFRCHSVSLILLVLQFVSSDALTDGHSPQFRTSSDDRSFVVDSTKKIFLKDGQPFQYIAGSMHYFRIPSEYWQDRLTKAKAAGLDAIQIYVPWNYHEPEEGMYNFEGDRDLELFLEMSARTDLLVILRAGPYICAEWDYGGLPAWLLRKNPSMRIRSSAGDYMKAVTRWMNVLLPKMRRLLYSNGGPIIMVQLENEYGSYFTCDQKYLSTLYDIARKHLGPEIVLFTTDGPSLGYLRCGSSDSRYLATIDFGPTVAPVNNSFSALESFRPNQPWVNSEFYVGWFDYWGSKHAHTSAEFSAKSLLKLMRASNRVSVNMYMFHGGTSFGLWAGTPSINPSTTSYDYDAPVSEAGDITPKYEVLRKAIFEFRKKPLPPLPNNITRVAYGKIQMSRISHILYGINGGLVNKLPVNMEELRQYQGFALYSTSLPVTDGRKVHLDFSGFADLAHIYTSDEEQKKLYYHTTLFRNQKTVAIDISNKVPKANLLILVENTGHVNYGRRMQNNAKGILGPVKANGQVLTPWIMSGIKHINGSKTMRSVDPTQWPIVGSTFRGEFFIGSDADRHDTYIHFNSFKRGILTVNGIVVGRYNMPKGPQLRLYVPRQFLRAGSNSINVIELEGINRANHSQELFVTSVIDQAWSQ